MADFVAHYSNTTGHVLGLWEVVTSSNHLTAIADGKLTVDGVDVLIGIGDRADLVFAEFSNPTDSETGLLPSVLRVDDPNSPTDVLFREDAARHPQFVFPEAG